MELPTITHNGLSLITIKNPTSEQIAYLQEKYGFSMLNLEDFLYKTQIPKIETYEKYNLVVMDIPCVRQSKAQLPPPEEFRKLPLRKLITNSIFLHTFPKTPRKKRISIGEVDFFIGENYVVILHDEAVDQISEIFSLCDTNQAYRTDMMGKGAVFLFYRIADILVDTSVSFANDITTTIDHIYHELDENQSTSIIEDISVTRRNVVIFETMVKPALAMFADLEKGKYPSLNGAMTMYWSNLVDHLQRVWDRLDDNRQLIEGISHSYESLLTVKTNEIIKVLTVFTAILLPLTLLASIYGMNVKLPFQDYTHAFTIIMLSMGILALLMVVVFKLREWI